MDWSNPAVMITEHFSVREALLLPSWGIMHVPSPAECENLTRTCEALEFVRWALGNRRIKVRCMIRPAAVNCPGSPHHGQDYNAAVGSKAKRSAHIPGLAVDFEVEGLTADQARTILAPRLAELELCMEDAPGTDWVHVDLYPSSMHGGHRLFKP